MEYWVWFFVFGGRFDVCPVHSDVGVSVGIWVLFGSSSREQCMLDNVI